MWFDYEKEVAPLYKDETNRRLFTTTFGQQENRRKKDEEPEEDIWALRRWLGKPWKERWVRWTGGSEDSGH